MTDTLQIMGDKQKAVERDRTEADQALQKVSETSEALKVERDLRQTLEQAIQLDKNRINELQAEVNQLRTLSKNYVSLQEEKYKLDEKCREQEETLEELGRHLSDSKLKISELTEEVSQAITESSSSSNWASDKDATNCKSCTRDFNLTRRKHHCRHCGDIFCKACSDNFLPISPSTKPVRLCDQCHILMLAKTTVVNE